MSRLDDIQRRFEDKLDAEVRRRRGEAPSQAPADYGQRLREYETCVQAQVEDSRRRRPIDASYDWAAATPAAPPRPSGLRIPFVPVPSAQPQIALGGEPKLRRIDDIVAQEFELGRYYPKINLAGYPTVYCETLQEFYEPFVGEIDVSGQARRDMVTQMVAEAEQRAERIGGGVFGVSLPGRGCYVNGWLFAYRAAPSARAALEDPRFLPEILGTVVHEKLGHGFVAEYTALGQEKKRLGAGRYDIARRFHLRMADTPEGELLAAKEAEIYSSSQLLEEGWATWIEHHFRRRFGGTAPGASGDRYTVEQVWRALSELANTQAEQVRGAAEASRAAVAALFLETPPTSDNLHAAVLVVQKESPALDDAIMPLLGQPLRYVIGYLLFRELEGRLGTGCLPYAACIAGTVTYGLDRIAVADLARLIAQTPRLNPDSRLAHLKLLDLTRKDDVSELARRAHDELSLTVPAELRV